jgi:hypothetical protein
VEQRIFYGEKIIIMIIQELKSKRVKKLVVWYTMVCDELTSPHIDEDSAVVEFNRGKKIRTQIILFCTKIQNTNGNGNSVTK